MTIPPSRIEFSSPLEVSATYVCILSRKFTQGYPAFFAMRPDLGLRRAVFFSAVFPHDAVTGESSDE
jgi:hypothetical protein